MIRPLLGLVAVLLISSCQSGGLNTQHSHAPTADTTMLKQAYDQFKETRITHRRFKHADLEPILLEHQQRGNLKVDEIGRSVQNKAIYSLKYGEGTKKAMLWSQMHGNEPTATMALLDLFNFFQGSGDDFDSVRNLIRENVTIHFIPMLNPDGSDRFIRRNALDVDLNRDARMGATPEGNLLKTYAQEFKPDYGFNLHDQNIYHNVPNTPVPVTIALLAPAYNVEREINDVRGRAMKIASGMNKLLQTQIPGAVAKYDDTYSPRSFGDNFQAWGASTVLIESGGYKGDPEKQYIRELNFMIILNALIEIAEGSYEGHSIDDYDNLPINDSKLYDVLIRKVLVHHNDSLSMITDLGINRDEIHQDTTFSIRSRVSDLGDLGENYGYDEIDASGLEYVPGKVYPSTFASFGQLDRVKAMELLRQGYVAVTVTRLPSGAERIPNDFPLHVFNQRQPNLGLPAIGREAHFLLAKDGDIQYAVVNGFLVDLRE